MLIGLTGQKGSGKDTVADFLVENYGFRKVAYADKMKESIASLFNTSVDAVNEMKNNPHSKITLSWYGEIQKSLTMREFIQRFGTEGHRDVFGKNFWIDALMKSINPARNIVVTDCRFDNEALAVRKKFGSIIKIERPSLKSNDNHATESGIDPSLVDHVIVNSGDLDDLEALTDIVVQKLPIRIMNQSGKLVSPGR